MSFLQQLEQVAADRASLKRKTSDVSARSGEACHEPCDIRIVHACELQQDSAGCRFAARTPAGHE